MKRSHIIYLAVGVAVVLAACNSTPAPDGQSTESPNPTVVPDPITAEPTSTPTPAPFKEELVICSFAEPDSIVGSTTYAADLIRQAVLPSAVTYGEGYTATPQLLTSLPSTDDGTLVRNPDGSLHITLNYRDDLFWSDGTPFTAADAVLGLSLPKTIYDHVFNVRDVQVVDDHTLEVVTDDADYPYVPPQPPLPSHVLTEAELSAPGALAYMDEVNPALGPYMVSEWQFGSHILLTTNLSYSGPPPLIDTVRFIFVPDPVALATEVLPGGSCDVALENGLNLDSLTSLEVAQDPEGVRVYSAAWPDYERLVLNTSPDPFTNTPYFADVRVRQAIAHVIDRAALSAAATNGIAPVLDSWLPAEHWAHTSGVVWLPLDVSAANALLDAAGWRDLDGNGVREYYGAGGTYACQRGEWQIAEDTPLAPTLMTTTHSTRVLMAEQIAAMLAQIGMDVQIQTLEPEVMFVDGGPISHRTFDMALFAAAIRPEPGGIERFVGVDVYQHPLELRPVHRWELESRWLEAEQLVETLAYNNTPSALNGWQGQNFSGWCHEDANLAIVRANTSVNFDERVADYAQHEMIYVNEVPELPLFHRLRVAASRSYVCGIRLGAYGPLTWNIGTWYFDETGACSP